VFETLTRSKARVQRELKPEPRASGLGFRDSVSAAAERTRKDLSSRAPARTGDGLPVRAVTYQADQEGIEEGPALALDKRQYGPTPALPNHAYAMI